LYRNEMRADNIQHLYSRNRLIRTEMFTLIGLMARSDPDYDGPPPGDACAIADRAEALLEELHWRMSAPWAENFKQDVAKGEPANPWRTGYAMREPISYGGEAAFSFKNCGFAAEKCAADDGWLMANKGASIDDMVAVTKAIGELGVTARFFQSCTPRAIQIPVALGMRFERGL